MKELIKELERKRADLEGSRAMCETCGFYADAQEYHKQILEIEGQIRTLKAHSGL